MHVIHGMRYVTTTPLVDMMVAPSVVKKVVPHIKVTLLSKKSSDDDKESTSSSSSNGGNELTSTISYGNYTPYDASVRNANGSLNNINIGVWCDWLHNSRYCNTQSPIEKQNTVLARLRCHVSIRTMMGVMVSCVH
jgi:hypothetical protein